MQSILVTAAILDFGLQFVGWAISSALQTEKYYDMFGSATFISIAILSLLTIGASLSAKQIVLATLVLLWALRLGTFLVVRVHKTGGDQRFDRVKTNPGRFAVYWFIQGLWVYLTLLPTLFVMNAASTGKAFIWLDSLGLSVFLLGFGMETIADLQKYIFKMDESNKGKFISTGLWKFSRHPNYFGEMVLWWGVYLVSLSDLSLPLQLLGSLSPISVTLLISFLSGIPLLERSADKRWGSLEEYKEYKRKTPVLVPFIKL